MGASFPLSFPLVHDESDDPHSEGQRRPGRRRFAEKSDRSKRGRIIGGVSRNLAPNEKQRDAMGNTQVLAWR